MPLTQGLAMVPATESLIDAIYESQDDTNEFGPDGYVYLDARFAVFLRELSQTGRVSYIETDYVGGTGTQSAATWDQGRCVGSNPQRSGAINEALRFLGASVEDAHDEFEALGLNRYRRMDDFETDSD